MSFELGRALLLTDAVSPEALGRALLSSAREGTCLVRAILATGAMDRVRLEAELSRADTPHLTTVTPARDIVASLPHGLCTRMYAIPVRRDPRTGTIDVVVADARDAQGAAEIEHALGSPVRLVRSSLAAVTQAVNELEEAEGAPRRKNDTPSWGLPPPPRAPSPPPPPRPAAATPLPPAWDMPIPLMRRSVRPGANSEPKMQSAAPAVTSEPRMVAAKPASDAPHADSLEAAVEAVVAKGPPKPTTLLPPPAEALPPPPETERRPPVMTPSPPKPTYEDDDDMMPPSFGASSLIEQMRAATSRDKVLDLLLTGVRAVAKKVALFIVKRDEFVGWSCSPEVGENDAVKRVTIPTNMSSVLAIAATNGSYLGPVQKSEAHAHLLSMLGKTSRDVAVVPVRVWGRATVMVFADGLNDTMLATKHMTDLAGAAGEALSRIVRERAEKG